MRAGCAGIVPLSARLEPWQVELCSRPELLAEWLELHGSPLNVLDPTAFARNAAELQDEADRVGADLKLYFARKANKALAFVDAAREGGLGVDVASERELRQALESGIPAGDLVVTAAVKPGDCSSCASPPAPRWPSTTRTSSGCSPRSPPHRRTSRWPCVSRPRSRGTSRSVASVCRPPNGSDWSRTTGRPGVLRPRDRRRALPPGRIRRGRPREGPGRELRAHRRLARARPPPGLRRHRGRRADELPRRRRPPGSDSGESTARPCSDGGSRSRSSRTASV